ncbi:MAG: glutaredoxin family protein [Chloroflexi bacterium]|nr:glutaredoxin family protein [Chloroflexota bacterium]
MPPLLPTPDVLTVYGADWCFDCRLAKRFLDGAEVSYRYVDLEVDELARTLLEDAGYRAIPVVVTPAGTVLTEPSEDDLAAAAGIAA